MKFFTHIFIFLPFLVCGQKETNSWFLSPKLILDFNTVNPTIGILNDSLNGRENVGSYSDENGQLLFYTNGFEVKDNLSNLVPNGTNLINVPNLMYVETITQGVSIINHKEADSLFYIVSMADADMNYIKRILSYSILQKDENNNLSVISKANVLVSDSLAEKMVVAQHCNKKDFWLIVVNYLPKKVQDGQIYEHDIEFLSFLVTKNGINNQPIRSRLEIDCPNYGQMKVSNAGNELAYARPNYLYRFNLNNSNGTVQFYKKHEIDHVSGYGVEYSPDDSKIYIHNSQFDIASETFLNLLDKDKFSQLQRASNGKIYSQCFTNNSLFLGAYNDGNPYNNNNFLVASNDVNFTKLGVINFPNELGANCNIDTIDYPVPTFFSLALPNYSSYHFNKKISDFSYKGICENEDFLFYLSNPNLTYDSIVWYLPITEQSFFGDSISINFNNSGQFEIECSVYIDSILYTSSQCINVCGRNDFDLPNRIDICETNISELNLVNPCTTAYNWSTGDTTSVFYINNTGVFTLEYTNECGVFFDTIQIIENSDCSIQSTIPNVFTPNNDNTNNDFIIELKNVRSFTYEIYNRWGNIMQKGNFTVPSHAIFDWNSFNLWNGYFHNEKANNGVYYYKIDLEKSNGNRELKSGFITIID